MHRRGPAIATLLGCLLAAFSACTRIDPQPGTVRSIYVEEAVGAPSSELARSTGVIHDTAVRTLRGRGYVAALEAASADAVLRAAWSVRPSSAGVSPGRVSLRMALVARDGSTLRAVDVIADVPAGFLTDERIAEHVREKLATFGR